MMIYFICLEVTLCQSQTDKCKTEAAVAKHLSWGDVIPRLDRFRALGMFYMATVMSNVRVPHDS